MINQAKIISGHDCQLGSMNKSEAQKNCDKKDTNISMNSFPEEMSKQKTDSTIQVRFEEDKLMQSNRILVETEAAPIRIINNKQFLEDIEDNIGAELKIKQDLISNPIDKDFIDSYEDDILMPRAYLKSLSYPILLNVFIIATSLICFKSEIGIDFLLDQDLIQLRHFVAFNFITIFLMVPLILFLKEHSYHTDVNLKGLLYPTLLLYTVFGTAFLYFNLVYLSFYSVGLTNLMMLLLTCLIVNFTVLSIICLTSDEVFDPIHSILVSFTFNILLLLFMYLLCFKGHNQVVGFLLVYISTVCHAFYINYNLVFILVFRNIKKWALIGNMWMDLFSSFPNDISTKLNGKEIFVRLDQ